MEKSFWQEIQKSEIQYHLKKDKNQILHINQQYWEKFLKQISLHVEINENSKVLDVGCGCCGVLLAVQTGDLVGVDPLMNEYLKEFEFLKKSPVTWIAGPAEDLHFSEPFDVIFSINSMDHMFDPVAGAKKMDKLLKPLGYLVISLNCHNTNFFYHYYKKFYRFIDPYHPHHFRPDDLLALFPGYETLEMRDIDYLHLDQLDLYRKKVLKRKHFNWNKLFQYIYNPFKYPMAFTRILSGRMIHRKKIGQHSIFSTYLFILRKKSDTMSPL